eukprot:CAMPEP_0180077772 /NCGR_PEP_ID=MMETSP0985-20121206/15906_1 /TAXON_ID=483367 /ORGANISM="non described non described, Strain CCMP 2436" /LENGTH=205 /DNA_ID=CAMNT_0022010189 /DNA_START=479 /DNA_END=1098 /DNA_ORIENTATION=+
MGGVGGQLREILARVACPPLKAAVLAQPKVVQPPPPVVFASPGDASPKPPPPNPAPPSLEPAPTQQVPRLQLGRTVEIATFEITATVADSGLGVPPAAASSRRGAERNGGGGSAPSPPAGEKVSREGARAALPERDPMFILIVSPSLNDMSTEGAGGKSSLSVSPRTCFKWSWIATLKSNASVRSRKPSPKKAWRPEPSSTRIAK